MTSTHMHVPGVKRKQIKKQIKKETLKHVYTCPRGAKKKKEKKERSTHTCHMHVSRGVRPIWGSKDGMWWGKIGVVGVSYRAGFLKKE